MSFRSERQHDTNQQSCTTTLHRQELKRLIFSKPTVYNKFYMQLWKLRCQRVACLQWIINRRGSTMLAEGSLMLSHSLAWWWAQYARALFVDHATLLSLMLTRSVRSGRHITQPSSGRLWSPSFFTYPSASKTASSGTLSSKTTGRRFCSVFRHEGTFILT